MKILPGTEIRILSHHVEKGKIQHAVFDFDGTISLLREGWERIMEPVMIESICGNREPTEEIVQHVRQYIGETTGIQTILQMQGLVEMVKMFGLMQEEETFDKWRYKEIYNDRLMQLVMERVREMEQEKKTAEDFTLQGSLDFCKKLHDRNIILYLASGTDLEDVRNEAEMLKVAEFFTGGIYGAIGSIEEYSKDKVMKEILETHDLHGAELVVFGDGPVEIRNAISNGAIAVGVASDEVHGRGWNKTKIQRLIKAGCNILIPDFSEGDTLLKYLFGNEELENDKP